eukprot:scaffold288024_cov34-Prasinocladus_malaysianus.AAC.1
MDGDQSEIIQFPVMILDVHFPSNRDGSWQFAFCKMFSYHILNAIIFAFRMAVEKLVMGSSDFSIIKLTITCNLDNNEYATYLGEFPGPLDKAMSIQCPSLSRWDSSLTTRPQGIPLLP